MSGVGLDKCIVDALFLQPALDEQGGVGVYCFGSTIMNWAKKVDDPFEITLAEVKRAIPRMQRVGAKYIRIMSFKPGDEDYKIPAEVFRRVKDVTNMFVDAGLQPVHENCMNYGGMSWQHGLEMLEKCPGLKWVFDTANPILNPDRSKPKPWPRQDSWEFWEHVRDHVAHIHIKDALMGSGKVVPAGKGDGDVESIIIDAYRSGYRGFLSLEPHLAKHEQFSGFSGPDLFKLAADALKDLCRRNGIPLAGVA